VTIATGSFVCPLQADAKACSDELESDAWSTRAAYSFSLSPCVLGSGFPGDGSSFPEVHNALILLASRRTKHHVCSCRFLPDATYFGPR